MKKLILGVLALTGACSMADANTLTVKNMNNCTYDLSIGGIGSSAPTVAAPGTTTFTSSTSPVTTISGVKIMFQDINGNMIQLNVGNGSPFASSMGLAAPLCPTPFNYVTAVWQLGPSGDITLTIM